MWLVLLVSVLLIFVCVFLHYEFLLRLSKTTEKLPFSGKLSVAFSALWALLAHTLEVWTFGICYYFLTINNKASSLISFDGQTTQSFFDCIYFSFISYTSLGYGDIIPSGQCDLWPLPNL